MPWVQPEVEAVIAQDTTWIMVEPDMYVRDGNGGVWRVLARRYEDGLWRFRLGDANGYPMADILALPGAPVTIMVPTIDDAEALISTLLPVNGVQRRVITMERVTSSPDSKWVRAAFASHLLNLHHVSISPTAHAENHSIAELVELHNLSHAKPEATWVPHIHVAEL